MKYLPFLLFISVWSVCNASSWDNVDFEIFDLYEEINGTFYDLLNITQDVSVSEIRRAYRKLSLILHPDKNKAADAEEKFRQLVAVYEILKDTSKREKYDDVLKNGLPTWRQPIYYYRKYRKMGTLELSIIISIIATIGHFLTWWVAYLEKKFEMDEILQPLRKREEKKKAKGKLKDDEVLSTDELLEKELGYRKPTMWDLLPFVIYRCIIRFFKRIPEQYRAAMQKREDEKECLRKEEEERKEAEQAALEKVTRVKRVKAPTTLRDASEFENDKDYFVSGIKRSNGDENNDTFERIPKKTVWVDEDYAALAKAMAKFPGGTPGRWDRIAHEVGRRPDEIIKKVKEMKTLLASNMTANTGSDSVTIKKKQAINLSDTLITRAIDTQLKNTSIISDSDLYQSQYDIPDDYDEGVSCEEEPEIDYTIVRKKVKTRPVEEKKEAPTQTINEESSSSTPSETKTEIISDVWSQVQQKCLEAAIAQFPKSTTDRWTCISKAVPNKTKEQCIARFKLLAEHVKQKKQKGS